MIPVSTGNFAMETAMTDLCIWDKDKDHPDNPAHCYFNNVRHGRWECRHVDGAVATGHFRNGKQEGLWEWRLKVGGEEKQLRPYYISAEGPWQYGVVLDKYSLKSVAVGHNESGSTIFDTEYTEVGGLLHAFKYRAEESAGKRLVPFACAFLAQHKKMKFDAIIPIPSSTGTTVTARLAREIASRLNKAYCEDAITTRSRQSVKGLTAEQRKEILTNSLDVSRQKLAGENVLLLDDLFDTGATLEAATTAVQIRGGVGAVYVFAFAYTKRIFIQQPDDETESKMDFDDDAPY